MRLRIAAAAIAILFAATPAAAAQLRLGIGGDYIFNDLGAFELTLAIEGRLARYISVEGRFGGLLATSPTTLGVPLDFGLRLTPGSRLYLEALIGPWIFFSGDAVRGHAAFGFGLETRRFSFGLEVGALTTSHGMIGARLAWRI